MVKKWDLQSSLRVPYSIHRLTIIAGEDGREGQNLSYVLDNVTFPRRTDLTEGHWEPQAERTEVYYTSNERKHILTFWHVLYFGTWYKVAENGIGALYLPSLPPYTHWCPSEDTAHSWVPRPCQRCSSTSPGCDRWAAHARSPSTQTLSESTDPAQPESPYLREQTMGGPVCTGGSKNAMRMGKLLTHAAIPLQHPPGLAGAFETSKCVQAVSVRADSLQGALVDVCHVMGVKSCFRWQCFQS